MTIEQWTLLVEIIASVGVIVSLIYLAIQIRQSTRQALSDNLESTVERWVTAVNSLMRSEQDANFLQRAILNYEALSAPEKARLHAFLLDLLFAFQSIFVKHRRGLLDPEVFEAAQRNAAAWFSCPGLAALWDEVKFTYPGDIVREVDLAVEANKATPFSETLSYLRSDE